jgi:hypothetical protein
MRRLLVQLDADRLPGAFDRIVAHKLKAHKAAIGGVILSARCSRAAPTA